MSRKVAREILYQMVFEYLFLKSANGDTLELMLIDNNLSDDDKAYIRTGYEKIIDGYDGFVSKISEHIIDFKLDRLFKTDLAALIIAFYEIEQCADIPETVSANEAVNIVKKFSTEKSRVYVNGVLAGYIKSRGASPKSQAALAEDDYAVICAEETDNG
ncbi:MAG: transcription antitermination factor NusB [Clostridiales bacterium]|jgi:N utilization substance protein B|nr:transcription antitermination factor NusB [Clostridiales bacterium]